MELLNKTGHDPLLTPGCPKLFWLENPEFDGILNYTFWRYESQATNACKWL